MIIITGPTSSGKTSLAIKIAQKAGAELISADSRQIYKYMDAGTGKRPLNMSEHAYTPNDKCWVINGIKVHMYDMVLPNEEYSSFRFAEDAKNVMTNIKLPIIVGGTGFYIDTLVLDNIDTNSDSDIKIREELSLKSIAELQDMIPGDYLNAWNNSDRNNPSRLIRAIQVFKQKKEWPNKNRGAVDPSVSNLIIELTGPRDFLYAKVDAWVDNIWDSLIVETKKLIEMGYENSAPMNGILYKTAKEFLRGSIAGEQAMALMKFDLHKYIRRQQTWFKKYKHSLKVDITEKSFDTDVITKVESYLNER